MRTLRISKLLYWTFIFFPKSLGCFKHQICCTFSVESTLKLLEINKTDVTKPDRFKATVCDLEGGPLDLQLFYLLSSSSTFIFPLNPSWRCANWWHQLTNPPYLFCVTSHTQNHATFNSANSVPIPANTGKHHDSIYTHPHTHISLFLFILSDESLASSSIFHWVLANNFLSTWKQLWA